MFTHHIVCPSTILLKLLKQFAVLSAHHVSHLSCKHKWCSFSFESELRFKVTQEVAEINMKEMSSL